MAATLCPVCGKAFRRLDRHLARHAGTGTTAAALRALQQAQPPGITREHVCIPGCDFTYQCGAGKVCADGQCVISCSASEPCSVGYACENGVCVIDPANPQCTQDSECGDGEVCKTGLCVAPCSVNADCGEGQICDASKGACIDDPTPKPACSDTVACPGQGQQCGPDGYCHYQCTSLAECKTIAEQFVDCNAGGGLPMVCLTTDEATPECTQADPCPEGESCISNECL